MLRISRPELALLLSEQSRKSKAPLVSILGVPDNGTSTEGLLLHSCVSPSCDTFVKTSDPANGTSSSKVSTPFPVGDVPSDCSVVEGVTAVPVSRPETENTPGLSAVRTPFAEDESEKRKGKSRSVMELESKSMDAVRRRPSLRTVAGKRDHRMTTGREPPDPAGNPSIRRALPTTVSVVDKGKVMAGLVVN